MIRLGLSAMLACAATGMAQTVVYSNLNAPLAGDREAVQEFDGVQFQPIVYKWGDDLQLTQSGRLVEFTFGVYNGGTTNFQRLTGVSATVEFYELTAIGTVGNLLGAVTIDDITFFDPSSGFDGLPIRRWSDVTVDDLEDAQIDLTQNIVATVTLQNASGSSIVGPAVMTSEPTDPTRVGDSSPGFFFFESDDVDALGQGEIVGLRPYEYDGGVIGDFAWEIKVDPQNIPGILYSNTTNYPVEAGLAEAVGTVIGDDVLPTAGGPLTSMSFSIWNSSASNLSLDACDVLIEFYGLLPEGALISEPFASLTHSFDRSADPMIPGEYDFVTLRDLDVLGVDLPPSRFFVNMSYSNVVTSGVGSEIKLGHVIYGPPNIGSSRDELYIDDGSVSGFTSLEGALDAHVFLQLQGTPTTPTVTCGDINCDGFVNLSDIRPFVIYLLAPEQYFIDYFGCPIDNIDVNKDGNVDLIDITPFVAAIQAGAPC